VATSDASTDRVLTITCNAVTSGEIESSGMQDKEKTMQEETTKPEPTRRRWPFGYGQEAKIGC